MFNEGEEKYEGRKGSENIGDDERQANRVRMWR